jgi:hypothetical protein
MIPPMCGVNMLINIVSEIVAPTFLYQSTVKSGYLPANTGNVAGNDISEMRALTNNITSPVLINCTRNIFTILEAFSSVLFRKRWKDESDTNTVTIIELSTEIPIAVDYATALAIEYP